MNIIVKKIFDKEQLEQSFAIRLKVFVEEQQVPADAELDEYDSLQSAAVHFLALIDGKPAGTIRMTEYDCETAKLQRLAVLEEFRTCHVGSALVSVLEQEAKQAGYGVVLLDGQIQARKFYEKQGYAAVSEEIIYDCDIPHVRMKKNLV